MIDVDLQLSVAEGKRRFDLAVCFATDAPFAALYGPSGAGKSLTLQAMAGLLRPDAGHVRIGGRTLYDARARIDLPTPARSVGFLFQNYALFPHLSVRDNVAFGLRSWRKRRLSPQEAERVQALLDSFGLTTLADSRPRALSGGQQQRVALARALACGPRVLLLDEPFAALHPALRDALRQELKQVQARWGIPVLMITHDVEDVLALADVAFVFDQGQVVQQIDLRTADTRSTARQQITGEAKAPVESPLRKKLRALLLAGSAPLNGP